MLFNTNYKSIRPPDYTSKYKIPYRKQTDFYNVEIYNDSFYLLEKQLLQITDDMSNFSTEVTDEQVNCIEEGKKLNEVIKELKEENKDIKINLGTFVERHIKANDKLEALL